MTVEFKNYNHLKDYEAVNDFLKQTYENEKYPNWLQPRWEYFHYHPNTEVTCYETIGLWKDNEKIVGLATHEGELGEVFIMVDSAYTYLKEEMLRYAEEKISILNKEQKQELLVHVNDFDTELEDMLREKGYQKTEYDVLVCQYTKELTENDIIIPNEFTIKPLSGQADIKKFHRVMWRGFGHEGEPPMDKIFWREKMQSAPNYNFDLNIALESPDGNYVSFSGVWVDHVNKVGYIEPVCTDLDYRRKGFGKIVVLECVRRAQKLGANVVYVESGQQFYQSIGFTPVFTRYIWKKQWNKENL